MMKKAWLVFSLMMSFLFLVSSKGFAGEMDVLIKVLVRKGILTQQEAQEIVAQTKQQMARDQEALVKEQTKPSLWVQHLKLKQDLRIRHQYERRNKDTEGRNRGRIRYRLGLETQMSKGLKAGVGLATGGSDSRSTNQTFQNAFDSPDIRLDYAYVDYQPLDGVRMVVGKHKRKKYLWAPTDFLWDSDINPEGAALHGEVSLTEKTRSWLNTGVWILDDNDQVDRPDPFMSYAQAGLTFKDKAVDAKWAAIYYGFHGVQGITLSNSSGTNTLRGGVLRHDYDALGVSMEAGVQRLFGGLPWDIDERIAVFGDFIYNTDGIDQGRGWSAGFKFGHKKAKKPGQWQAKYIYVSLGKDAFIDAFPDSDRYGGATDVESHEVLVQYVLREGVTLGVDYYRSDRIKAEPNPEHLVQADVQFQF